VHWFCFSAAILRFKLLAIGRFERSTRGHGNVDAFTVRYDGSEEFLAGGLDTREVRELQEWWRFTKPLGPGVRIVIRAESQIVATFSTSGTEPGQAVETLQREIAMHALK
jgi:hypothetical protein